jgi:hypothetical protein
VIEGKKYDTATATRICKLPSTKDQGSFAWHDTALYRSPKGAYFLAGTGEARSMWAKHDGGDSGPGTGMQLVTTDDARGYAEEAGLDAGQMQAAGFTVEEG